MFLKNCCKHLARWFPLIFIVIGLVLFFYFRLYQYFSLQSIKVHQHILNDWVENHYFLTLFLFVCVYTLSIAMAITSAFFLDVLGGFLFGTTLGTLCVSTSVTLGATLLFLAVRISLADWLEKKTSKRIKKMEKGFRANAFNYIITLRLIPVFPFWLITIAASLLKVSLKTFVLGTFLGVLPATLIYTSLGWSLHKLFLNNEMIDSTIIFKPEFLYPLIGLALLVVLPIIYDYVKKRK